MSGMTPGAIDEPRRTNYPQSFEKYVVQIFSCVGRDGAAVPNSTIRRALFERSELRSHIIRRWGGVYSQGRARAEMVLVPFAVTKGTRRAGAKPRYIFK